MEKMIENLVDIFEKVQNLKTNYQLLKTEKENLEVQLNHLKVEIDHYKSQIVNIKKERETIVAVDTNTTLSTSENPTNNITSSKDESIKGTSIEHVKLQLDGFMEDIDQCIQIIQNSNNG